MAVFVIIAALNEEGPIAQVVAALSDRYEVVVIDDGSGDDTAGEARRAGARVLRHPINRGQGAALQTGIRYALARGAEILVTFDADGQHKAEDVDTLIAPLRAGHAEIALGSRFLAADEQTSSEVPWRRRLLLRGAIVFTWLSSGVRLSDAHNGMRAFTRRAAEGLDIRLDRMAHASEIIDQVRRSGLPYVEVPVRIRYTEYSLAKGQRGSSAFRVALDYLVGKFFP